MNFKLATRVISTSDYTEICHWWESHSWPIIPLEGLSKNGVFIFDEVTNRGVCAGWVFSSDSSVAWMEYLVKNPEFTSEITNKALDLLIHELIQKSKDLGFTVLFTTTNSNALTSRYDRLGFLKGDEGMTQFILPLSKEGEK